MSVMFMALPSIMQPPVRQSETRAARDAARP
jgi:hypothetical protein